MRDVVPKIVVECDCDGERLTTPSGSRSSLDVDKRNKPAVAPQELELPRELGPGDWRNEFTLHVAVAITDIVVEQDRPHLAIGPAQHQEDRPPEHGLDGSSDPRGSPHRHTLTRAAELVLGAETFALARSEQCTCHLF